MKVYISNYRNHWLSPYTILERVLFWKDWENISYDEPWVERWSNRLEPVCKLLQWTLDRVRPRFEYVKIDRWDTWSMDSTLSTIILPMLRQLKATKHGYPLVDDADTPEYLRSHMAQPKEYEWDVDSLAEMRWDWVLNEMIWAFEQKVADDADGQFFDHSVSNGKNPWDPDYVGPRYDRQGHEVWQARKNNGFRLFGKYYEALWD